MNIPAEIVIDPAKAISLNVDFLLNKKKSIQRGKNNNAENEKFANASGVKNSNFVSL